MNLPKVHEAILDDPTLDRLFFDVAHAAELLEVVTKGAAETHAGDPSAPADALAHARESLRSGAAFGVQLRYRFGGIEWWDTLMRVPEGIRLVRIDRSAVFAAIEP
ncbi:MAG: hypothetical protein ACXVEE_18195 [Polyangiales bacterium]